MGRNRLCPSSGPSKQGCAGGCCEGQGLGSVWGPVPSASGQHLAGPRGAGKDPRRRDQDPCQSGREGKALGARWVGLTHGLAAARLLGGRDPPSRLPTTCTSQPRKAAWGLHPSALPQTCILISQEQVPVGPPRTCTDLGTTVQRQTGKVYVSERRLPYTHIHTPWRHTDEATRRCHSSVALAQSPAPSHDLTGRPHSHAPKVISTRQTLTTASPGPHQMRRGLSARP